MFLFYDIGYGKQTIYTTKGIKHCNVICYNGTDHVLFETDWHGIHYRVLSETTTLKLLKGIRIIPSLQSALVLEIFEKKQLRWFPLSLRTCNELCRYVTGVDVGITINPTHLIKKLLKYNNKRNYEIIHHWWRKDNG